MPVVINEIVTEIVPSIEDAERPALGPTPVAASEEELIRTFNLIQERRDRLRID